MITTSQSELKELLKNNERYKTFTILDAPIMFKEKFAGIDADVVQLHSIQTYGDEHNKDILGFCGVCKWKNNILTPCDGDSYSDKMTVYGYEWWSNKDENVNKGLDILVGTDW